MSFIACLFLFFIFLAQCKCCSCSVKRKKIGRLDSALLSMKRMILRYLQFLRCGLFVIKKAVACFSNSEILIVCNGLCPCYY